MLSNIEVNFIKCYEYNSEVFFMLLYALCTFLLILYHYHFLFIFCLYFFEYIFLMCLFSNIIIKRKYFNNIVKKKAGCVVWKKVLLMMKIQLFCCFFHTVCRNNTVTIPTRQITIGGEGTWHNNEIILKCLNKNDSIYI